MRAGVRQQASEPTGVRGPARESSADKTVAAADAEEAKDWTFRRLDIDAATVTIHMEGLTKPEKIEIAAMQLQDITGSAGSIAYQVVTRFLQQVDAATDSAELKRRLRQQLDPDTLKRILR